MGERFLFIHTRRLDGGERGGGNIRVDDHVRLKQHLVHASLAALDELLLDVRQVQAPVGQTRIGRVGAYLVRRAHHADAEHLSEDADGLDAVREAAKHRVLGGEVAVVELLQRMRLRYPARRVVQLLAGQRHRALDAPQLEVVALVHARHEAVDEIEFPPRAPPGLLQYPARVPTPTPATATATVAFRKLLLVHAELEGQLDGEILDLRGACVFTLAVQADGEQQQRLHGERVLRGRVRAAEQRHLGLAAEVHRRRGSGEEAGDVAHHREQHGELVHGRLDQVRWRQTERVRGVEVGVVQLHQVRGGGRVVGELLLRRERGRVLVLVAQRLEWIRVRAAIRRGTEAADGYGRRRRAVLGFRGRQRWRGC